MSIEFDFKHEVLLSLGFTFAFGTMFLVSELMYKRYQLNAELTRKFIHISCGCIALLIPIFHPHLATIVALGTVFSILTWLMLRKGQLPSVHAVDRISIGSVLYPLGIVACTIFGLRDNYQICFFIPLTTLVFSDTVAAAVGINTPLKKFKIMGFTKSIGGCLGFFLSSLIIYWGIQMYFLSPLTSSLLIQQGLIFAALTTVVEMLSVNGWDDLSVPTISFAILLAFGF